MSAASLKNTATTLLAQFGQAATYTSKTVGAYSTTTLSNTITETDYSVTIGVFDYETSQIDSVNIQRGDCYALCSTLTIAPKINDSITFGGMEWSIVDFKNIGMSGSNIMYKLQLRR